MQRSQRAWVLLAFTALALTGVGCNHTLGRVNYQAHGPSSAARTLQEVTVFHLDCKSPNTNGVGCTYQGNPPPWTILGVFRIPKNAYDRWEEYEEAVRTRGAKEGCPAVAIRSDPPGMGEQMGRSFTYSEPIGAFCIDPTGAEAAAAGASAPAVAPAASAPPAATAEAEPAPAPDAGAPAKPKKKKKKK